LKRMDLPTRSSARSGPPSERCPWRCTPLDPMVGNRVLYISKACKASSVLLKLRVWKDDYHQKSPSNSKIHSRTDTRNTDTNPVACRYGGTTCQRNRESKHCRWPHSHLTSLVSISAAHPHHGPAEFQWT
jgi:hypothetical protein